MNKSSNIFSGPEGASPNYEEGKIVPWELPDLLSTFSGETISSFEEWLAVKRPELLGFYEKSIFGTSPFHARVYCLKVGPEKIDALRGIRAQLYDLYLGDRNIRLTQFIVFSPVNVKDSVPAFLGPNILGNQSLTRLFPLPLTSAWTYPRPSLGIDDTGHATAGSVGVHSMRWPLEMIIQRGYAVVSFHNADFFPDKRDGRSESVQPLFDVSSDPPFTWGAIATWAWGIIKVLDCLKYIEPIDEHRIIATGHSRLGKACLWAAAQDTRFAAVIANESGEGGCAISRRKFGERISDIVTHFPHWFTTEYQSFSNAEEIMPVDSHCLISLVAPRSVYVASAGDDLWSDPVGEFTGLKKASVVWKLAGKIDSAPEFDKMPRLNTPLLGTLSYHIRSGGHSITSYDWQQFLTFADRFIR
ncbi:alpha/beta hydrolase family protein [Kluyvera sichuanensis]|uniref:alpha/beta hydrolase family protein n=1 Tax=Kluyvera sichuanensis TaxID=2725494 RepID=UPI0039F6AE48